MNPTASQSAVPLTRSPAAGLAVPRQDGSTLLAPARQEWAGLTASNIRQFARPVDLYGMSLTGLRSQARHEIFDAAAAYTSMLADQPVSADVHGPLAVTGHQPELFHAGVWAKNFAVHGLARQLQGTGLNLIIDNDIVDSVELRVPAGTRQAPVVEFVPFDRAPSLLPWEDSPIQDPDCFRAFGQRVTARIHEAWHYEPLLAKCWPAAIRLSGQSHQLGDCLAAARVQAERSAGLRNLEVPFSRVCETRAFCTFAAMVMADLPRFHAIYNDAVAEYRRQHHIRNLSHPVPNLATVDEWLEAPFWVWRAGGKRTRPLIRRQGHQIDVRDDRDVLLTLPASGGIAAIAEGLTGLAARGIRLRTRALTTTLFARVFLADLFLHGIGGATYDTMTDRLCRQFLGIEPPAFAVATATRHLPLGGEFPVSEDHRRQVERQIRELRFNPDRFASEFVIPVQQERIAEKQRLLHGLSGRRPTKQEHQALDDINRQLFAGLDNLHHLLIRERDQVRGQLRANSILQDREFSWCLFHSGFDMGLE